MKIFKKVLVIILIFQAMLFSYLKTYACTKAEEAAYRASHASKHYFPVGAVVLGGIYSITAGQYALNDVIRDIPRLKKWSEISKFEENRSFNTDKDLQNYLISRQNENPLFLNTALIASNEDKQDNNLIKVLLFKPSAKKSNIVPSEKIFLVENEDIKNDALNLHYMKIPQELVKSNKKLVAETTLIYSNYKDKTTLDFGLFKKVRLRALEGKAGKYNQKALSLKEGENIVTIRKEFKINSPEKPLVLAVYTQSEKNKNKLERLSYSSGKYIALIKIKAVN